MIPRMKRIADSEILIFALFHDAKYEITANKNKPMDEGRSELLMFIPAPYMNLHESRQRVMRIHSMRSQRETPNVESIPQSICVK